MQIISYSTFSHRPGERWPTVECDCGNLQLFYPTQEAICLKCGIPIPLSSPILTGNLEGLSLPTQKDVSEMSDAELEAELESWQSQKIPVDRAEHKRRRAAARPQDRTAPRPGRRSAFDQLLEE